MEEQANEHSSPRTELHKILAEMALQLENVGNRNVPAEQLGPGMTVHRRTAEGDTVVEVAPGIMVSQSLIDEAVRLTSDPEAVRAIEQVEQRRAAQRLADAELARDIETSRTIVQGMLQRMREPQRLDEKFVSYDTMPAPLQRIVKAYIDAEEANQRLAEAVAALAKDLTPPSAPAAS